MIHVTSRSHDHLESGNNFTTSRTITYVTEQSQVVPFAQNQVGFRVQSRTHFSESTVAATALQTILVPVQVQRFEEISVGDGFATAGAFLRTSARIGFRWFVFGHVHGHHWAVSPSFYLEVKRGMLVRSYWEK